MPEISPKFRQPTCCLLIGENQKLAEDLARFLPEGVELVQRPYFADRDSAELPAAPVFALVDCRREGEAAWPGSLELLKEEAIGLVASLKHMSAIDTNGFPRGFSKTVKEFEAGGTHAH